MELSIQTLLKGILDASGFAYSDIEESLVADQKVFTIRTDDGRTLIGPHGDTIHALDMLVKRLVEKKNAADGNAAPLHFIIDVNDYRVKQIHDLQQRALMMAERARSFQYDVELSPMSGYERLLVHATLSGAPNIKTESAGEGRERRIVIKYVA